MPFLAPHLEKIYALFRIMAGLLLMQHGFQKLFGWFGGVPAEAPAFVVYGAGARLELHSIEPHGVRAQIHLPPAAR